ASVAGPARLLNSVPWKVSVLTAQVSRPRLKTAPRRHRPVYFRLEKHVPWQGKLFLKSQFHEEAD
ncbi:predicted protein, partial [Arabidopsis lyrata subsp. lyrata]